MRKFASVLMLVCLCFFSANHTESWANQTIDQAFNVSNIPNVPFSITWNDGTPHSFTVTDYILTDFPAFAYYPCADHFYQIRAYNSAVSFTHVDDYGGYINTVDTGGEMILDIEVPNVCTANFSTSGNYNIGVWNYAIATYGGRSVIYSTKDILNTNNTIWHASDLPQLTIKVEPLEGGSVTGTNISCNVDTSSICQYAINQGAQVSLTANPNGGWLFSHWTDGTNNYSDNPHLFTINGNTSVKAVFRLLSFPLAGYNPYNAPVSSVFDHTATGEYTADADSHITAFNGEFSDNATAYPSSTCYAKDSNHNYTFGLGFNYTGVTSLGGAYYLCYNGHPGYDYAVTNADVTSAAAGTVTAAGFDSCLGNFVDIAHTGGYKTRYFHLSSINTSNAQENCPIAAGVFIGTSGNTGSCSSGPHLHFQVEKEGIPIDPYGWTGFGSDPYTRTTNINLWK